MKEHCIQRGLPWDDSLASTSCQEQDYYEDLLRFYRYNYRVCSVLHVLARGYLPLAGLTACLHFAFWQWLTLQSPGIDSLWLAHAAVSVPSCGLCLSSATGHTLSLLRGLTLHSHAGREELRPDTQFHSELLSSACLFSAWWGP